MLFYLPLHLIFPGYMDRNQVIGFLLLAGLLVAYIVYNNNAQQQYTDQKKADSAALATVHPKPAVQEAPEAPASPNARSVAEDSLRQLLPPAYRGEEKTITLENEKISLSFSTKGGYPLSALIKGYKTYDQEPLYLFEGKENQFGMLLPVQNEGLSTADLYYTPELETENGNQILKFTADLGEGKSVVLKYTLPSDEYMMQCRITTTGMGAEDRKINWITQSLHTERDITNERTNSQIYYRFADGEHDYFTITEEYNKALDKKTHWVGFRMHFFSTALIADAGFDKADIRTTNKLDNRYVTRNRTDLTVTPQVNGAEAEVDLRWYIGPNHYTTLRSYKIDLDDMVPLGYGIMAFVKYINKWLIIPIFNVLSSFISNFGVIIMLMTIIIRLILSFFTYKSYLSAAKMRVLKPEMDELRAKFGNDQQKFGMEQMKLYRSAGVNPLGGCLPTLLQLPILFAMFYFFPSSIELRQESFLWAEDLSTYDSIASWTAHIPLLSSIYGNHVSLFTLLMTASSLFLALYNRNMTVQDPNNPMLKWMPYVFPFLLIGVFNKMAAGLTFYYFFSNMISIAQQFIIQKYIIDEKKIHAKIQENKNKPVTPSKWQQRLEEMQKSQAERVKQGKR